MDWLRNYEPKEMTARLQLLAALTDNLGDYICHHMSDVEVGSLDTLEQLGHVLASHMVDSRNLVRNVDVVGVSVSD